MPPWAAFECERTGWTLDMIPTDAPSSAAASAAAVRRVRLLLRGRRAEASEAAASYASTTGRSPSEFRATARVVSDRVEAVAHHVLLAMALAALASTALRLASVLTPRGSSAPSPPLRSAQRWR